MSEKVTVLCPGCQDWYESRPPNEVEVPDDCPHCDFKSKRWHSKTKEHLKEVES